jgi:hypothetical protein
LNSQEERGRDREREDDESAVIDGFANLTFLEEGRERERERGGMMNNPY